jgi:hypothetical protein
MNDCPADQLVGWIILLILFVFVLYDTFRR